MALKRSASKSQRMWGGFSDGKLHVWEWNDGYGNYKRVAVFTNRRNARGQYQDVRRIEIKEVK